MHVFIQLLLPLSLHYRSIYIYYRRHNRVSASVFIFNFPSVSVCLSIYMAAHLEPGPGYAGGFYTSCQPQGPGAKSGLPQVFMWP